MGAFANDVLQYGARIVNRAATQQAGILGGANPATYNANDPYPLWVIQIIIITAMIQLLAFIFGRIRQPRVIAEVIGGIILGPSIMGRIPKFTSTIFPTSSRPLLSLTSTIGLVFFMFIVGVEIDFRLLKRNARASAMISIVGLIIPLGLGAAIAVPLYHQFVSPSINMGYFILFVAVAVGITAFPVLCRILSELKLLDTTVGVVVLGAGAGNDIVGWILLALAVALVNAANGLTALYVLLTGLGFVLFMMFPVRIAFRWIAKKTDSLQTGQPSTLMMSFTLFIVLVSAFFTDIIGIHPIFGGFVAGIIVPHDNGIAIAIVEKLEDLVSIIFLPLYFVNSGLNTNLGLLNNGVTWGYTILLCVVSFASKFLGCSIMAKINGFNLRESGAVGALMSCKGLVELIVLNVGLQAGILDTRTFSMFVLHALVLTFMTTPLTLLFYPARLRVHAGAMAGEKGSPESEDGFERKSVSQDEFKTRFSVILDKIEQLPAVMTVTQLLQQASMPHTASTIAGDDKSSQTKLAVSSTSPPAPISLSALRLIELTERSSAVLKSQEADYLIRSDPIISVFRTFGLLNRMLVSASLSVVNYDEFSTSVARHVREASSQMVIVPWKAGLSTSEPVEDTPGSGIKTTSFNPFDNMFKTTGTDQQPSPVYSHFIRKVFASAPSDVALILDRGLPTGMDMLDQHIFLPFFGGPDDRLALSFTVQLCAHSSVTATVVRMHKREDLSPVSSIADEKAQARHATISSQQTSVFPDTIYGVRDTQTRLASDTADNILWGRYSTSTTVNTPQMQFALNKVHFQEESSSKPLHSIVDIATVDAKAKTKKLLLIVGRSRRMASESHDVELKQILTENNLSVGSELPKTLGDVATAFVTSGINASVLVMQAATSI